jgi:hypothetical protein
MENVAPLDVKGLWGGSIIPWRNGCDARIRQKGIFEIDLKERGVRISALNVEVPKA